MIGMPTFQNTCVSDLLQPRKGKISFVEFKRPQPGEMHRPGEKESWPGTIWAIENANVELDKHGGMVKLNSPIAMDDRIGMSPMERDIEEYLYHEKEHFHWVATVIRRGLMTTQAYWQDGINMQASTPYFVREGKDGNFSDAFCREDLLEPCQAHKV